MIITSAVGGSFETGLLRRDSGVTEIAEVPNRGHSLTVDSGWREVAERALEFVRRFA